MTTSLGAENNHEYGESKMMNIGNQRRQPVLVQKTIMNMGNQR
jgi:hypothetical protein